MFLGGGFRSLIVLSRGGHAGGADLSDIAEQLLEEAAIAAQGRRFRVHRVDRHDLLQARALDRGDVAGLVTSDVEHRLVHRLGVIERELSGPAAWKSGVSGKSVYTRCVLGGRSCLKKNK